MGRELAHFQNMCRRTVVLLIQSVHLILANRWRKQWLGTVYLTESSTRMVMQHPSSDRLITTHNATYIEPRFMPGYRGHCPLEKFDYGQTYGNFTAKQFQDYRSTALNSSMTPYRNGGIFPTYHSYTPDIVINNRKANRERYTDRFDVNLYNTDHARQKEIQNFDLVSVQQQNELCWQQLCSIAIHIPR
ncbi:hypothetical protein EG68_11376 [Paragonimus skrjabini miyazakii]|uniref:Ciliary microtubule inner protein 2C n=1 Tax=Paragonimus skrjabini miyazakii TaxID=59628 RepID=A0A8S9YEJ3_9TREM|nr:hypothetical protein EG68_11376 [Paragonimus skrjabini miyazakii]